MWRWTRRVLALGAAVIAALFVTFFSIDLGRFGGLKQLAEEQGSAYLGRPLHIGRLSALMTPGRFEFDDVVIEGLSKTDRPFFTARRIVVQVPWWTIFRSQIFLQVRMTGWHMLIEKWPDGRHNVPRLTPKPRPPGPKRFTTTVNFVYAEDGEFTYEDHGTPWSVVAPNLNFALVRDQAHQRYDGTARFTRGSVQIQDFLPMSADMSTRFVLDGGLVRLEHIDLITDGAVSHLNGAVDFSKWPEQVYNVDSEVDFHRMHDIFFAHEHWSAAGTGHFEGIFHIPKEGAFNLTGRFASDLAVVAGLRFPNLSGSLEWRPDRFRVTDTQSDFYGGAVSLAYGLEPLGTAGGATASFTSDYDRVDVAALAQALSLRGIEPVGRASGQLVMSWHNGHFGTGVEGQGWTNVDPPADVRLAAATLPPPPDVEPPVPPGAGPVPAFNPTAPIGPLPVGGKLSYHFDGDSFVFDDSAVATPTTHVAFHGSTAYGERSNLAFHVTSRDWQASDRLLAAVLTASGSPTGAVDVGGRGTFDGSMMGSFHAPRIQGTFDGTGVRAWDVTWGRATGHVVIENRYVDVTDGVVRQGAEGTIRVNGRFSLGYPREDHGEEIDTHVTVAEWPMAELRHAFGLDDWPVDATIGSADVQLHGPYHGPLGSGTVRLDNGVAWKEHFAKASGSLAFEGNGMRIDGIDLTKATGQVTGAAWIGWDGTYSFTATGNRIPVESLDNFKVAQAPLSGMLQFTARGAGAFASPSYEFTGQVADLFAGDEGVGQVSGHLIVRNKSLTVDQFTASSARLQVVGSGTIALDDQYDADLSLVFLNTSIDPYLKIVAPRMSPYTRAIASASVRITGPLADYQHLGVYATDGRLQLTLFDYQLQNDGPISLSFANDAFTIGRFKLTGEGTNLDLQGDVSLADSRYNLTAGGKTNLEVLHQFPDLLTSAGEANLEAKVTGPLDAPAVSGYADISGGTLRYRSLPQSFTDINGRINFDGSAIRLDELTAKLGDGPVTFTGGITLTGFTPDEFNLGAQGTAMSLRYPEGFRSTVNAALTLSGPVAAPTLSGTVDVLRATYVRQIDLDSLVGLATAAAGGGGGGSSGGVPGPAIGSEATYPLKFAIQINAPPGSLVISNKGADLEGSADLSFRGTLDRPSLTGRVDVDTGEWTLNGNRYRIRQGSIEFSNPTRIEPFFDVDVTTRVHAQGQSYDITLQITGTTQNLTFTPSSDPWLSNIDILTLLLGASPDVGTAQQRALQSPQQAQAQFMQTAGLQILASPISSRVGNVFEKVVPLDTVQITPLFGSEALQQLNPTARITLGERLSSRLYLTYSRTLNAAQYDVILLEYEQSDRVSWVLSRNEDRTFALDFRIRYVF
jgi:TamB, inner membrane protein subunit of TAM complex